MWRRSKKIVKEYEKVQRTNFNKLSIKSLFSHKQIRWSLRFIIGLSFIALFGDFIANDKPLYCKVEGKSYFPILDQYWVDLGVKNPQKTLGRPNWYQLEYERVIRTPIPYNSHRLDMRNMNGVSPFGKQNVKSSRFRHLLGTDNNGRDVAAGLISGTRYAILVGLVAMSIAALIGIFFGLLGGYLGDDRIYGSLIQIISIILGVFIAAYWGIYSRWYQLSASFSLLNLLWSLLLIIVIITITFFIGKKIDRQFPNSRKYPIAVDQIVLRIIEIIDSIPPLLLILAIIPLIKSPSIIYVMIIIGLVSWTGIARFVRAEVLKVRDAEYIQAARVMQFSTLQITLKHVLPNSLSPVLIVLAFGMAGSILAEAAISFLGIGLGEEEVTWGALLNQARELASTWWLAIFPGLAIFLTVLAFNNLGEGLNKALNPKSNNA